MKKFLLLILIFITISSCKFLITELKGVKKPRIENKKSILKYLKKIDVDTNNVISVNKDGFLNLKKFVKGIPEILVFNHKNEMILYKEDSECNGKAFDFIKKLNKDKQYKTSDSIKITDFIKYATDLDGNQFNLDSNNYDYIVFIFWAKYIGNFNKDYMKKWECEAYHNINAKIKVFKVTTDLFRWRNIDVDLKTEKKEDLPKIK